MATKKRKVRRATLRGWWKPLPFLLLPFSLMFLFATLEGRRLQTEYEVIELITKIRAVNRDIDRLSDERRELNRIEVMDQQAPSLNMVEPGPEQRVILSPEAVREAMNIIHNHTYTALSKPNPSRTVLYDMTPEDERSLRAKEE